MIWVGACSPDDDRWTKDRVRLIRPSFYLVKVIGSRHLRTDVLRV